MSLYSFHARELFNAIVQQEDFFLLDVRNDKDFARFPVEGPHPFAMLNVSYYDFMELEEESVAKVPKDKPIRIVCAQEGSAKYVGEILVKHGFAHVGYLEGGIKSWGNLLVPMLLEKTSDFALYQFIRPAKASCSYGLVHGKEMMVFDPTRNIDFYLDFAAQQGCMITKTIETHLQADYIAGSKDLAHKTGAVFLANDQDFKDSKNEYQPLQDGESIRFSTGGPSVRVFFSPGHTPGSTCFILAERYLVSGDTIFINSVGRPDLGGKAEEWAGQLFDTIQKIQTFDSALVVLPGHFADWSEANAELLFALPLGEVLNRNQNIYTLTSKAEFVSFIKANMRSQPEEYAIIRQVNANLIQKDDDKQEVLDLGKNECAATAYAAEQQAKRV
ncbi:MAG: MBL fold metallo-hydrolase [Desulfobulbus sp.]|jgi:glyoxylase-like metal-dependent hydrolase (beta-lactamase superfamily II)/rhodanese-related sulfurtransferase